MQRLTQAALQREHAIAWHINRSGYNWNKLRDKYPDLVGVVEVSRPGYDASHTRAVVVIRIVVPKGIGEFTYVLQHASGEWSVLRREAMRMLIIDHLVENDAASPCRWMRPTQ